MNKDLPELQQFLAGYFHQDWTEDHENASAVVASFLAESPIEKIERVKQELNTLIIAALSENELQDFLFYKIGCNYYYPHEWSNGASWLTQLYSTLSEGKKQTHT